MIIFCILLIFAIAIIIWIIWSNRAIQFNTITVKSERLPDSFSGYRIAHVSDMHNTRFGENNEELIEIINSSQPDIIAITGDMIDSYHTDVETALQFAKQIVKIAPCYYVTGNHESRIDDAFKQLKTGLTELGVTVLRNETATIEKNSEKIILIGVDDPSFAVKEGLAENEAAIISERLSSLTDSTDAFTALLSHRPELFDVYAQNDIDLVLSGHAHGGQIRIPFIGAIFAPNQGLFPKYDSGLYTDENTNMVVSRGIGNSSFPFRVNNRPEIILIELEKA